MPSWKLKKTIQNTIAAFPRSRDLNYLFQKYVTRSMELDETQFEEKLCQSYRHVDHYQRFRGCSPPRHSLELGTGRHPIVPLSLYLMGYAKQWSVDIEPLMRKSLVIDTLVFFLKYGEDGRLARMLPGYDTYRLALFEDAMEALVKHSVEEVFKEYFDVSFKVADAQDLPFEAHIIDFFYSNNTLEHIDADIIANIFFEFKRVGTSKLLMSHLIDMTDHFWYFDKSITPYNFLEYSQKEWDRVNNSLLYQTRNRIPVYRAVHTQTGFKVLMEDNETLHEAAIHEVQLAPEFQHYCPGDLVVTQSWMVSELA